MTKPERAGGRRVSRRDFLFTAAVGTGAVVGVGLASSPAFASTKRAPRAVSYRPTPNGHDRCSTCINFQPPAACKLVDGVISPSGWCVLFAAK